MRRQEQAVRAGLRFYLQGKWKTGVQPIVGAIHFGPVLIRGRLGHRRKDPQSIFIHKDNFESLPTISSHFKIFETFTFLTLNIPTYV